MSVEGGREEAFRTYQKMEEEKNMGNQPKSPEAEGERGLGDLERKLADGTMTPQEAETYAGQFLDGSPDLLAKIDEIDQLSMPTPEQINLGLGTEADQERASRARQSLIDQATTRAVTFYVREAGRGAYKDVSPDSFVKEVRDRLRATMEKALVPIMAEAQKSADRRARGEKAASKQAA